ncbi:uncharacterized protein miple2 isoform X3 [Drosophila suzukii]|uniref:Uncharacterized protein miple2 isoform X3 n=1 Tax=Drosophila suzukii TaxID=28584 RepID=A0AB40D8Z1_DROSZ
MNLLLTLTTVLQLVVVVLAQIPSSIDGELISDGIRLVMERSSGDVVHFRPARGALDDETVAATTNKETHRLRKNRKPNKSQEHFQQVGGHKSGSRKLVVAENGSAASEGSQPKHKQGYKSTDKQQRQGPKQQHGHGQHHGGCRYDKGTWSQCIAGQMTREDKLEAEAIGGSDQNCNPVRTVNKKCKANGNAAGGKQHGQNRGTKERKQKDKSAGRISPHDQ